MIESYDFGRMNVDGETHTNDLKIFPETVKGEWWRDEGHLLQLQDIEDVLEYEPDLLIIGQGAQGRMEIDSEVREELESRGIDFIAKKTSEAVQAYNEKIGEGVVGIFHLTC